MADTKWLGRAGAVADVITVTIANTWAQGDTVSVKINGKTLTATVGASVTTADVATLLKEAWEAETATDTTASYTPSGGGPDFTEHAQLTATVSGSVVTLTGDTAGEPWYSGVTVSEVTAGDGTATGANPTPATGPNHVDNADNWSSAEVPGTSADTNVWIENSDVSLLYGALATVQDLTSFNVANTFTGDIGLPNTNANGYPEFRADYLQVDATTLRIHGEGQGSGRIKIDSGSVAVAVIVENTGSPTEPDVPAFIWKGSSATNSLRVAAGSFGAAVFDGETASLLTAVVATGSAVFGQGVTFQGGNTIDIQEGSAVVRSHVVTVTIANGSIEILEDATVTTLNVEGTACLYKSSGTITTANVGGSSLGIEGLLDLSQSSVGPGGLTITTLNMLQNGRFYDPLQVASIGTLAKNASVGELISR
jgi:hypothetical protein